MALLSSQEMFTNNLRPAGVERLAWIAEECGEVVQAIGKVLRHGYESGHPLGTTTNRQDLERELGNLRAALTLAEWCSDVSSTAIKAACDRKIATVGPYLHYQREELARILGEDDDATEDKR